MGGGEGSYEIMRSNAKILNVEDVGILKIVSIYDKEVFKDRGACY